MKKLLGSTLALALLVPAGANAELLKNLKVSGSLEVDAVDANNVTNFSSAKYNEINTVQTRLMLHADWDVLDDVHAHVSIDKNDRTYGQTTAGQTPQNLNTVQSALFVDEAYVKIDKLFGAIDTTLGRQYYGEPGDMVIYFGPKYQEYGMPITALDAGRFDWNSEKVGVTLLASKVTSGAVGATDSGNIDLSGLDVHVKPMDNVSGAIYLYDRTTINSGTLAATSVLGNDYLYVAGLKGKVTMGGAWLKAEFDKDFGSNRVAGAGAGPAGSQYTTAANYTGWAGKINLGYKADLANLGALTGWGEGSVGSGGAQANRNFQSIAGDYRPGSIYGRFGGIGAGANLGNASLGALDTGTLSDRVIIGAGVKMTPASLSKLTAGLSWWNFRAQNETALHVSSPVNTQGNVMLGNEYDLDLTWAHSENVTISAGVGDFQPGGAVNATNGGTHVSPARLAFTDFSFKF